MSLPPAVAYMDKVGVRVVTLTPDSEGPFASVTTDRQIRPGTAAILRNRVWLAVLEHRRALHEGADVLGEPWTLERRESGAWILQHPSCRLLSLPRYKASAA